MTRVEGAKLIPYTLYGWVAKQQTYTLLCTPSPQNLYTMQKFLRGALSLSADLFEAAAMQAVAKDLLVMKVTELKEELEVRGEGVTGNKAWLRRRLHAAIVCEHLAAAADA